MDTSFSNKKGRGLPSGSYYCPPSHASGAAGQIRMSTSDYDLLLPVESPRESGAISLASLGVSPFLQTLGAEWRLAATWSG